jgi:hypothetical protein
MVERAEDSVVELDYGFWKRQSDQIRPENTTSDNRFPS